MGDFVPRYLIRDRDQVYGAAVRNRLRAMGITNLSLQARLGRTGSPKDGRIDPTRVFRPCDRLGRGAPPRDSASLCPLLQRSEDAPIVGQRRAILAPVQRTGSITSQALLGGLHHQYVRASKPKLMMIDELSLGLAPQAVERISEALREINRAGITILLVEQDVATAFDLAHHAFVIEQGKVAIHGKARALAADPKIRQAYMGIC